MHTDTYPHLYKKFKNDNFDVVVTVLLRDYPDLFPLEIMEEYYATGGRENTAYTKFFENVFSTVVKDKYTEQEVQDAVGKRIIDINDTIYNEPFVFPIVNGAAPKPLGFVEKFCTGHLGPAEPLSHVDMVRSTRWFSKGTARYKVIPYVNLTPESARGLVVMVNLQTKANEIPKWVAIDNRRQPPVVYCESPILESEREILEQRLGAHIPNDNYQGGAAALSVSSGYTALAWCMGQVQSVCALKLDSDFLALVEEFCFAYPSTITSSMRSDYREYTTSHFKDSMVSGNLWTYARPTILGELGDHTVTPSDLCAALPYYNQSSYRGGYDHDRALKINARSYILGFDNALGKPTGSGGQSVGYLQVDNDQDLVTLTVPQNIDYGRLQSAYSSHAGKNAVGGGWMEQHVYRPYDRACSKDVAYGTAMVLAVFRSCAKLPKLHIDLPSKYRLDATDTRLILKFMQGNPYVCELTLGQHNRELHAIQQELLPIFARNRWLRENNYKPPMFDNFWKHAAYHWLVHLNETPDVLEDNRENRFFKKCVKEMGLEGIQHVLAYLNSEVDRDRVEKIYGLNKPPFYIDCLPNQMEAYLDALLQHLHHGAYFPFSEIGVTYQHENRHQITRLITELNNLDNFETITLSDCLQVADKADLSAYLTKLARMAQENNWTTLVVIPELQDKNNVNPELGEIRSAYALLNDVILSNQRQKHAHDRLRNIEEISKFDIAKPQAEAEHGMAAAASSAPKKATEDVDFGGLLRRLEHESKNSEWDLARGGDVQLQLQQQQEIQQQRQIQQQSQRMQVHQVQEAFFENLIDYNNIDERLGRFFQTYREEHEVKEKYALLKTADESLLQGFFHTWVNANPNVDAKHAIRYMTKDAVVQLLKHQSLLVSGLKLDNLPKGFFLQRSRDGSYILSYKPDMGYVYPPNAQTLRIKVDVPTPEFWEGDFRQFDIGNYYKPAEDISDKSWQYMALFAKLQPDRDYTQDFEEFVAKNPRLRTKLSHPRSRKEAVIKHWPVVLQAWQYLGEKGVDQFIAQDPLRFELNDNMVSILLTKSLSPNLQEFVARQEMTMPMLKALGQVYYRFGDKGMSLLLSKFAQIEATLGQDFFFEFSDEVLRRCENYNTFMNEGFFTTMDSMMEQLKGHRNAAARAVWLDVVRNHYQTVDWDDVTHLWKAFSNFHQELARMGLTFDGEELRNISPNNMIVIMDRILDCLRHTPNATNQRVLLDKLADLDLTLGGVSYAIVHEKFRHVHESLHLHDFAAGTPTYAPQLAQVYQWTDNAPLMMQRSLASIPTINADNFRYLSKTISEPTEGHRDILVLLANTRFESVNVPKLVKNLRQAPNNFGHIIAANIHQAVYRHGHTQLDINWEALDALSKLNCRALFDMLRADIRLLLLEGITLLHQKEILSQPSLDQLLADYQQLRMSGHYFSEYHTATSFKLGLLFGQGNANMSKLIVKLNEARPVAQQEARLLFRHLLTVDFEQTDPELLHDPKHWDDILGCITRMSNDPANTEKHRLALIDRLTEAGIEFKFSKAGNYRALMDNNDDKPESLRFFVDHEDRIWKFVQGHIAVKVDQDAREQLAPIMNFCKQLQVNATYLNELEPLLSVLEQAEDGQYWSAQFFNSLLNSLVPPDESSAFPINMLKAVLKEAALKPSKLDEVVEEFPDKVSDVFTLIQGNNVFSREEQAQLAQLAMREYRWSDNTSLTNQIVDTLSTESFNQIRGDMISVLFECESSAKLEQRLKVCRQLAEKPVHELNDVKPSWPEAMSLWMRYIQTSPFAEKAFKEVTAKYQHDQNQQAKILHIIAWSSLDAGLLSDRDHGHEIKRKMPKLVDTLGTLSPDELDTLVASYPGQPSPRATDILYLMEKDQPFTEALDAFERHPFIEPRSDYHPLALSRQADLERMLREVQVTYGKDKREISVTDCAKISLIFTYLKDLESGRVSVEGVDKPIHAMNKQEIADAFKAISQQLADNPEDIFKQAQAFALMFEALGRTTRKYPHLAQQFALISNQLLIDAKSRVLQLSVGEGKSHYVAMQAARYAAQGKVVDVNTSKDALAIRDLADYKDFFNYLGLTSTYIKPDSSYDTYMNAQIHYSKLGDVSLFQDELMKAGQKIDIPPENRVALFDEFDFTRFEEGRKTEYNYAISSGIMPKQLMWFYQSVNEFYDDNKEAIRREYKGKINGQVLAKFAKHLVQDAGDLETQQQYVAKLIRDPLKMVQLLQSAHQAASLQRGVGFTVLDTTINVGEERYPMQEVTPLTSDSQRIHGSTFSVGVHQLLAVRLNSEAKMKGEPQNFHVHAESHILSSQVAAYLMMQLWGHREGFSGTISDVQKQKLWNDEKAYVLSAPTNRRVQRKWHPPMFYRSQDERAAGVSDQLQRDLTAGKSVLTCFTNDKQVEEFRESLMHEVPEHLHEQLMFYTNEDPRAPKDVLADKKAAENWHGDTKERGIALMASGFGRGDNTGTECVYVLGTRSVSELIQKGGRTARNGSEGDVYQFYDLKELEAEHDYLCQQCAEGTPQMQESLGKVFEAYPDEGEEYTRNKHLLDRVLVLKEYCFELDNIVNETYHFELAQFSGWGMELLSKIDDPILRNDMAINFSSLLSSLEKARIDIDARKDLGTEQKLAELSRLFRLRAEDYLHEYNDKAAAPARIYERIEPPKPMLKIAIPETTEAREHKAEISALFIALTNLPDVDWTDKRLLTLTERLSEVNEEPYLLRYVLGEMRHAQSGKRYLDWFDRFYRNWKNPSAHWQKQLESVLAETADEDVLDEIQEHRDEFLRLMYAMDQSIQDKVANYLNQPHAETIQHRVNRLLPVLRYLNEFVVEEQVQWGAEYIDYVDTIHEEYTDMMVESTGLPAMECTHFQLFSNLLRAYPHPESLDNMTLFGRLCELTQKKPEMQIRILGECESIVTSLPEAERGAFFHNMLEVVTQYARDENMGAAKLLLANTKAKLANSRHKPGIEELWRLLAENLDNLKKLVPLMERSSGFSGSAWYAIVNMCLDQENATLDQLIDFQGIWCDMWDEIDKHPGESNERRAYFKVYLEHTRRLDAEEVANCQYDKLLQRCFGEIAKHGNDFNTTKQAVEVNLAKIDKYSFQSMTDFVQRFDQLMDAEKGFNMTALDMVNIYVFGRQAGLSHEILCDADTQHVIRELYRDLKLDDELEHPAKHEATRHAAEVMHAIGDPALCRRLIESFQKAARPMVELSTIDAMEILYNNKLAGMNKARYARYEHVLSTVLEKIATTHETAEKTVQAMTEYVFNLVVFDHHKLQDFVENKDDILHKSTAQQVGFLLGDCLEFTEQDQQYDRIWRMRMLRDGVLCDVNGGDDYEWTEANNSALMKTAFSHFSDAFKALFQQFTHGSKDKPQTPEAVTQAHKQAMNICQEVKLIGNITPSELTPGDEKNATYQLNRELRETLVEYKNSWFINQLRTDQSENLTWQINREIQTNMVNMTQLLQIIQTAKFNTMRSDLDANRTRWFKLNRGGRSRYYETLNKMQATVLKYWAREYFDLAASVDGEELFRRSQDYQDFVRGDLKGHLGILMEEFQRTIDSEAETKGSFFESHYKAKHKALTAAMDKMDDIRHSADFSSSEVHELMAIIEDAKPFLSGDVKTIIKDVDNIAQTMWDEPKPDIELSAGA